MTAFQKGKSNPDNTDTNNLSGKTIHLLKLPYKGDNSINVKKSIKTSAKKTLPDNHVRIILIGTKLSSHFHISKMTQ